MHEPRHPPSSLADSRLLAIALALICGFMAAELAAGLLASSLALLSDAGHMLTDAGAIALAMAAIRLGRRPPKGVMTYGLRRAEILSAQINGISLLVLSAVFAFEGIRRLLRPPAVRGGLVFVVGLVGIVVNLLATVILARANRTSLNVRGAFQHVRTDLVAFVATSTAGGVIWLVHGLYRLDAAASLVVAALMARAGYRLVREAVRVLLEAAPRGIDPEAVRGALTREPEVDSVEDLHIWEITSGFPALSAHVRVKSGIDCHAKRRELERVLTERFGIEHTTLQVDHTRAEPEPNEGGQAAGHPVPSGGTREED